MVALGGRFKVDPGVFKLDRMRAMLEEMGVATGVDLPSLIAASSAVQEVLGRPLSLLVPVTRADELPGIDPPPDVVAPDLAALVPAA